ncbi:hypothetical protein, partial [Burkholderia vietnamiensis]|uniref:hypothetical protein n=1 Tax=Burkholderia vietnamiensis TaxID=60552 RepID=UPI00352C81D5
PSVTFSVELDNGSILTQSSGAIDESRNISVDIIIKDTDYTTDNLYFKLKMVVDTPITWVTNDIVAYHGYRDGKYGTFNKTSWTLFEQRSLDNNNASTSGSSKMDLFKSIPETKCVDFLLSFFKMFNISIFDASPDNDKLYWLTPKDVASVGKEYSKKEVNYTNYVTSRKVTKEIANEYNYYNFKHKTSKYKSNEDYKSAKGYEFGQLTYPTEK